MIARIRPGVGAGGHVVTLIGRIEKMPAGKITPSIDRHKLECPVVEQMSKSLKQ
ncbi:hypothetical protein ACVW1C_005797 [Bradyrhizobium sp. USDA 4011]